MPNQLITIPRVDLRRYPLSDPTTAPFRIPFGSTDDTFMLGDLHGNNLKLLYFLLLNGLAYLSEEDFYRFVQIYDTDLTKEQPLAAALMIYEFDAIVDRIKISKKGQLLNMGDLLCDRVGNDAFTLKNLSHCKRQQDNHSQRSSISHALIANHCAAFIRHQEALLLDHDAATQSFGEESGHSSATLYDLLTRNIVSYTRVWELYDDYKMTLKAIHYRLDAEGNISHIFTHGINGELEIYKISIGLYLYAQKKKYQHLFTQETLVLLKNTFAALPEIEQIIDQGIPNQELIFLIEAINATLQHNAKNDTLTELIQLGFHEYHYLMLPEKKKHAIDNGKSLRPEHFPFHTLIWNRRPPQPIKNNPKKITHINGHDESEYKGFCYQHISLDNTLGKGYVAGRAKAVGELKYYRTGTGLTLTPEDTTSLQPSYEDLLNMMAAITANKHDVKANEENSEIFVNFVKAACDMRDLKVITAIQILYKSMFTPLTGKDFDQTLIIGRANTNLQNMLDDTRDKALRTCLANMEVVGRACINLEIRDKNYTAMRHKKSVRFLKKYFGINEATATIFLESQKNLMKDIEEVEFREARVIEGFWPFYAINKQISALQRLHTKINEQNNNIKTPITEKIVILMQEFNDHITFVITCILGEPNPHEHYQIIGSPSKSYAEHALKDKNFFNSIHNAWEAWNIANDMEIDTVKKQKAQEILNTVIVRQNREISAGQRPVFLGTSYPAPRPEEDIAGPSSAIRFLHPRP